MHARIIASLLLSALILQPPQLTAQSKSAAETPQAESASNGQRQRVAQQRRARSSADPGAIPTRADVPYGDHPRHVLDFWAADAEQPTPLFVWIHGGGFRSGDKKSFPSALRSQCLEAGISCASIHYRLSSDAPYPAPMIDSARAIQFLRAKASEWNVDPNRIAAGGGSAGSGISQWLAYHDDLADADSSDPVARQSTRLCCVFPINMQSTYDPRDIKRIIPGKAYNHPALVPFFDRPEGWDWDSDPIDAELDAMLRDASPITHLSKDDVPIFLLQNARSATPGNIHHPKFGEHLKAAADQLGLECIAKLDTDYSSKNEAYQDMVKFMQKCFESCD